MPSIPFRLEGQHSSPEEVSMAHKREASTDLVRPDLKRQSTGDTERSKALNQFMALRDIFKDNNLAAIRVEAARQAVERCRCDDLKAARLDSPFRDTERARLEEAKTLLATAKAELSKVEAQSNNQIHELCTVLNSNSSSTIKSNPEFISLTQRVETMQTTLEKNMKTLENGWKEEKKKLQDDWNKEINRLQKESDDRNENLQAKIASLTVEVGKANTECRSLSNQIKNLESASKNYVLSEEKPKIYSDVQAECKKDMEASLALQVDALEASIDDTKLSLNQTLTETKTKQEQTINSNHAEINRRLELLEALPNADEYFSSKISDIKEQSLTLQTQLQEETTRAKEFTEQELASTHKFLETIQDSQSDIKSRLSVLEGSSNDHSETTQPSDVEENIAACCVAIAKINTRLDELEPAVSSLRLAVDQFSSPSSSGLTQLDISNIGKQLSAFKKTQDNFNDELNAIHQYWESTGDLKAKMNQMQTQINSLLEELEIRSREPSESQTNVSSTKSGQPKSTLTSKYLDKIRRSNNF